MLPSSYMITTGLAKIGDVPAARGGFADIWDGTYQRGRVAIKALRIYRADDRDTLERVNQKFLPPFLIDLKTIQMFCKEVILWKQLLHPNILPLLGVSTTLFPFCMVSPWMKNGNVTEHVRSNPEANRMELVRIIIFLEFSDGG